MDEGMTNFAEYRVTKKVEGTYLLKRILFIAGWTALPLAVIIIGSNITFLHWLLWFTPGVCIIAFCVGRLTFRYLSIEYEYSIVSGDIRVDCIYGNAVRKQWLEVKLREMSVIAPYDGEYKKTADAPDIKRRYEAVSSLSSPDAYFGTFTNEQGEKSVLFFEATRKILGLAKFYNRSTIVRGVRY